MSAIGPGDWVECIDASPGAWDGSTHLLAGALYIIRDVTEGRSPSGHIGPGYRLVGIILAPGRNGKERSYCARRFRPIYRPKSELIESLLKKADEPVKEDA